MATSVAGYISRLLQVVNNCPPRTVVVEIPLVAPGNEILYFYFSVLSVIYLQLMA